ncbi:lysozyme inhibitor LprI family protein [uncultured Jannaschia sp.]|uniref:lysozyme inhibitor LprI family protein n=1 Tax=uncultured Jannaschia sp. TaxID=293347 RepID=UPI0034206384
MIHNSTKRSSNCLRKHLIRTCGGATRLIIATTFIVFTAQSVTYAQDVPLKVCDLNDECDNTSSQLELKQCIGELRDREDTRLNDLYRDLLASIPDNYENPSVIVTRLRASQREWIEYRDSYCDYKFSTAEGGTIGGLLLLDCECTLTRDKADHLFDEFPI